MDKGVASDEARAGRASPEPASSLGHSATIANASCRNCAGCGWVCENHLDTPWHGLTNFKCCGGAGSPCPVCEPEVYLTIKSDSCHPDDPGQYYIDCPNCAAGRIYSLECDSCGWEESKPLRDWSHRRRPAQGIEAATADETRSGSAVGESPVAEGHAPIKDHHHDQR